MEVLTRTKRRRSLKPRRNITGDLSQTLSENKSRRNKQNTTSCPICHKVFNRGTVSVSEINKHVLLCSDAQVKLGPKPGGRDSPSISSQSNHDADGGITRNDRTDHQEKEKHQRGNFDTPKKCASAPQNPSDNSSLSSNDLLKSPISDDSLSCDLDDYNKRSTRKTGQTSAHCPICGKTWKRSIVSISEINEHVAMCAEAQMYDTESSSKSSSDSMASYGRTEKKDRRRGELSKSQQDWKKSLWHPVTQSDKEMKEQRSQSLQCLKKGSAKKALEMTVLKYFDSRSTML